MARLILKTEDLLILLARAGYSKACRPRWGTRSSFLNRKRVYGFLSEISSRLTISIYEPSNSVYAIGLRSGHMQTSTFGPHPGDEHELLFPQLVSNNLDLR